MNTIDKLINLHDKVLERKKLKECIVYSQELDVELREAGEKAVFETGIGKIHPFMRSHKMLDSMQHLFEDIPIVMFYPGTFNGQTLNLFDEFKEGNYYRAFNLL